MKRKKGRGKSKGYWFWSAKNAWFHTFSNGKRERLIDGPKNKDTEALAKLAYCRLMTAPVEPAVVEAAPGPLTVASLAAKFLASKKTEGIAPDTLRGHTDCLRWFCEEFGSVLAADCEAEAVSGWLKRKGWKPGTRKRVSISVCACFRFGVKTRPRLLTINPLDSLRVVGAAKRDFVFSASIEARLLAAVAELDNGADFIAFFKAVRGTGSRPSEIASLTAAHLVEDAEAGCIVAELGADEWKAGEKTGRTRTIYLIDELADLVRGLAIARPDNLLFTCGGKPWNRALWSAIIREARKGLGLKRQEGKVVLYAARSTYLTAASNRPGANLVKVAEATGTSLKMLQEHYLVHSRKDFVDELRRVNG